MTISQFVNILLDCCKATYHREAFRNRQSLLSGVRWVTGRFMLTMSEWKNLRS